MSASGHRPACNTRARGCVCVCVCVCVSGLKLLRLPGEVCPLLDNPAFARTSHWQVSTSNLTSEYYTNWGWGQVVPDGEWVRAQLRRRDWVCDVQPPVP